MFEYTFNKPSIIYLELINPLLQDINLQPYILEYIEDVLKLVYTEELTNEQYNILNVFITNYEPLLIKPDEFHSSYNISIIKNTTSSNEWVLIGSCQYIPNIDISVKLIDMTVVSNIESGDYQFRVYCMSDNMILGTSDIFDNTIRTIHTINIENTPTSNCIIELHAKVSNTESICKIDSAQLNLYVKGN
jgi:hypothetical protein